MMSRLNNQRSHVPAWWQRFAQICLIAMTCVPAQAVTVGQVDAFAAGDAAFWQQPHAANPPVRIASNGALGPTDGYLLVQTTGAAAGAASRMVTINDGQWTGNFSSVGAVSLFARNLGPQPLYLRLALMSFTGGSWVSTNPVTIATAGPWQKITFPITVSQFTQVEGTGTFAAALGNVYTMRLVSAQPAPSYRGDIGLAMAGFDEIKAEAVTANVPLPLPALVALCLGLLAIAYRAQAGASAGQETAAEGDARTRAAEHHNA